MLRSCLGSLKPAGLTLLWTCHTESLPLQQEADRTAKCGTLLHQ
jgi:hypothetical protein